MKESRVHERIRCNMEIECTIVLDLEGKPHHLDEPLHFEVLNLSVGGILVKSSRALEPEQLLQFTFYLEDIPYVVMSRVRWHEAIVGGYLFGIEFLTISNMLYRHLHDFTARNH